MLIADRGLDSSVERLMEYSELPQEPRAVIKSNRPPAYWPSGSSGNSLVVVEDLNVRYSPELPLVLRGISFELKAGKHIGIVGRTGSGKSSLLMSLLGLVSCAVNYQAIRIEACLDSGRQWACID